MVNGKVARNSASGPNIRDLLLAELPTRFPPGHEQTGLRPVLVVANPYNLGTPRYPTLIVVPLSSNIGLWSKNSPKLYPVLTKGLAGLVFDSVALLDNIMALDVSRVRRRLGCLGLEEYAAVRDGLLHMQVE